MQLKNLSRIARTMARPAVVALACIPLWAAAQAAAASFAGPSIVRPSDVANFTGRGFTANGALSISVTDPGGSEAVYGAVAGPDGTLTYQLAPRTVGAHLVRVLDSSGNVLAQARVLVSE